MLGPVSPVAIVHRLVVSEAATAHRRPIATENVDKKERNASYVQMKNCQFADSEAAVGNKESHRYLDLDALLPVLTISMDMGLPFYSVHFGGLWHVAPPLPCLSPAAPCKRPRQNGKA
jgi:hypothetical protein